jgi:hypothetical protein
VEKFILVEERVMGIIVKELETVKVARCKVIAKTPEYDSWKIISASVKEQGVFDEPYRFFGRNNPNPGEDLSLEEGVYAYEFTLGTELIEMGELEGG